MWSVGLTNYQLHSYMPVARSVVEHMLEYMMSMMSWIQILPECSSFLNFAKLFHLSEVYEL